MPINPYKHLRLMTGHREIIDELTSADLNGRLQFQHSCLSQVSMPYRAAGPSYEKRSGPWSIALHVDTPILDSLDLAFEEGESPQVPYGSKARLVLLALQTRAIRSQSATVDVRPSFTAFAKEIGISTNGPSLKALRRQMVNLSLVRMRLWFRQTKKLSVFQGPIFSRFSVSLQDPEQNVLFPDTVRFSNDYFESLQQHALPLRIEAIRSLRGSARSLDLYSFLAFRLRALKKPTFISWQSLQVQFSDSSGALNTFKRAFIKSLIDVTTVYPEARVEKVRGGIRLFPSKAPVQPIAK